MLDHDYDLFVIGGGSGGVRAARVAAATGARVAIAEDSRLGGTCVIRGCVPKKLMVFASSFREMMPEARAYGWDIEDGSFEWPVFHDKLEAELDRLEAVYRKLLDGSGVEVFEMRAKVAGSQSVALSDGRTVSAAHILVATGGHPIRPELKNAEFGMVSDDLFHMTELPRSILIVGGGYIACEFACILHGLGVEVTQFYRGAQILRGFDGEARGLIADAMEERGIDLHLGTNIVDMRPASEVGDQTGAQMAMPSGELAELTHERGEHPPAQPVPMWVKGTNGMEKVFDRVLFATGRVPNTSDMGLEEAGVEIGRRGEIVVDEFSATSVPSIHAIGDVTNRVNLTPVAIREGMAFVDTVFKQKPTPVDHDLIPSAVFTQPELGTIGLSEEEARDQEPVDIYCTSFRPMRGSFAGKPDRVLMKLIVSKATEKVLGCHIVADGAGEMIQLAGVAIKMGATKADFDRTVAVHPTMAEELVTMRDPIRSA